MASIPQKEQEILEFWNKEQIFQKSLDKESPQGDYVFYDGPPFATGLPHYGHLLSSIIKDVVPRYYTMRGYHVRRRWGWDCHGLPIENLVEKKLKVSGKKQIEAFGVDTFNDACRAEVLTYTTAWKDIIGRIGRWVEFDDSYKTMDNTYMESVWWALKQLWDKELIYEGKKVLLFCPHCETPVSKFEVAMDNSYHDVTEMAVFVKFKLHAGQRIGDWSTDDATYMLAWTTTPWTLPGNVALAVSDTVDYVLIEHEGEKYILARERLNDGIGGTPRVVQEWKGSDLISLTYEPLYDVPQVVASGKRAHYVTAADFVTTDDGTGIVHTAVVYGEDDYNLGVRIDLPMVPLLNTQGKFTDKAPELVREMNFKEADEIVILDLQQRGLLYKQEPFTHSYPHCWRCESPLFYNAIDAWFVNIQKIKKRLLELNENINWYPEHLKHGRFKNNVENAPDWNISRNRYWATALPFWKCDDENCGNTICIGSVAELKDKATNFSEVYPSDQIAEVDLHKHLIDKIILKCEKCGGTSHRVPEVIDCWVESGSMPFAEYHYPFENKETFESRFPGQYIAEYIAQTRAWFYYMHVMGVALFDKAAFQNVVSTGTIMAGDGTKMSKSKKNFPDPWDVVNKYGADALRFYLMNSVVMQAENLDFDEKHVREIYNKVVNTLYNVTSFYKLYEKGGDASATSNHVLDQWIMSLLHRTLAEVTTAMDGYDMVAATRSIEALVQELSTWYVRRRRDRFKGADRGSAIATLRTALTTTAQIVAPFLPFTAEYIWKEVGEESSVHMASWPQSNNALIREELMDQMTVLRELVERAHALRSAAGAKVRQPLATLEVTTNLSDELRMILAEEVNVKEVNVVAVVGVGEGIVTDEAKSVALHTALTDALKQGGMLRELVRTTNALRKEKNLQPSDTIEIRYSTASEPLKKVISELGEELGRSTAATKWTLVDSLPGEPTDINGESITLAL